MVMQYVLIGQTPVPEPDVLTWSEWFETADRIVFQTEVGASVVSTVFLGVCWRQPPLLFETMIFTDGEAEDFQWRCSSWLQAEAQHGRAVKAWSERLGVRIG